MPLHRFHNITGRYVQISPDGSEVKLLQQDPLGAGLVFMDRPLRVFDMICIHVNIAKRDLVFGFSTEDPITLVDEAQRQAWRPYLVTPVLFKDNLSVFAKSSRDIHFWSSYSYHNCLLGVTVSRLWLFVVLARAGDSARFIEPNSPQPVYRYVRNLQLRVFHRVRGSATEKCDASWTKFITSSTPKSFDEGLLFSSRPIKVNAKVCVHIDGPERSVQQNVHVGFTDQDPASLTSLSLIEKSRCWIKPVPQERLVFPMYFYTNASGEIYFSVESKPERKLLSGVSLDTPLWAMIYVPVKGITVAWINSRSNRLKITYSPLIAEEKTEAQSTYSPLTAEGSLSGTSSTTETEAQSIYSPLTAEGSLSGTSSTTETEAQSTCSPLTAKVSLSSTSSTTESEAQSTPQPTSRQTIPANPAPDPPELLLGLARLMQTVAQQARGEGASGRATGSISTSEVTDGASAVKAAAPQFGALMADCYSNLNEVWLALIDAQIKLKESSTTVNQKKPKDNETQTDTVITLNTSQQTCPEKTNDCIICYETLINTAFSPCGHMCTCYECALKVWKGKGECPICRKRIHQVLRVFTN